MGHEVAAGCLINVLTGENKTRGTAAPGRKQSAEETRVTSRPTNLFNLVYFFTFISTFFPLFVHSVSFFSVSPFICLS